MSTRGLCLKVTTFITSSLSKPVRLKTKSCQNYEEIQIKMPWGHIAGKLWGNKSAQPILAIHGWQDNAGSFDTLAPNLEADSILAIDLPGHGLSTWLPAGSIYDEIFYMMVIHRIKNYFNWSKVMILAHSMSAAVSFMYSSTFPNETQFVVAIDYLKPPSIEVAKDNQKVARNIDKLLLLESLTTAPPGHTEEDIIKRWMKATKNSIDETACKILMKRGTKLLNDKYYFTRDPSLKVLKLKFGLTHDHLQQFAHLIKSPYLLIKATDSWIDYENEKYYNDIKEIVRSNSQDFEYHVIEGSHHLHLTNAEAVANAINPFIKKYSI